MESPGEYLKREREIRGVALEDISNATKIRAGLLVAIERNDFGALPAAPFVKGFIRAYCKYLGLDVHDALLRYEAYMRSIAESEAAAKTQRASAVGLPQNASIAGKQSAVSFLSKQFSIIAVIIVLAIAGGIYTITKIQKKPASDPSLSSDEHASSLQSQHGSGLEAKKEDPSPPANVKSTGQSRLNRDIPASAMPSKAENKEDNDRRTNDAVNKGSHTLVIEAINPTWIKAEVDSRSPFEVSLKQGEKVKWNADEKFSILIGNAGGVNVIFNGSPLGKLGEEGNVVKLVLPPEKAEKSEQP